MGIEQLGPYRLLRRLGRGGMGMVFEAESLETGELAAVKMLDHGLAQEEGFRERFRTEIETLRKLNHPGIVRLLGFGEQDEQFFYVMELVPGASLEQHLQAGRKFAWREVARWAIAICQALRHAHDRGIIHRDLKPANLLVDAEGHVKLADFGIARLFGHARITAIGSVLGTAEYMSPEQADGLPVDHRSDLYSLGAVLYALLCGRPPFRGRSLPEVLQMQRTAQPEPIGKLVSGVPEEFQAIIAQLLDKNPERRCPNAVVLMRRIEGVLERLVASSATVESPLEARPNEVLPPVLAPLPVTKTLRPQPAPKESSSHDLNESKEVAADADVLHDEMPVTHPTSAFHGMAEALQSLSPDPEVRPPASKEEDPVVELTTSSIEAASPGPSSAVFTQTGTRFVRVTDLGSDSSLPVEHSHRWLISLQTWLLAATLAGMAATLWYLLQPPTADQLYEAITARTADASIDSLLRAESDIERFLTLFPTDSRCSQLRASVQEIQLYRLERKFGRRAAGVLRGESLLPVEQAYLEAIHLSQTDPEQAMVKLRSLLALYDHRSDELGPTGQCVALARRRLERLREQVAGYATQYLDALQDRLDLADSLAQQNPGRAREIREAIVDLYAAKPWAAKAVARAREALRPSASPSPERKGVSPPAAK